MLENEKAQAQQTLDELWAEHGIPFKLTAHNVEAGDQPNYYRVYFLDSRLPQLLIYSPSKESFNAAFRSVIERTVGKRSQAKGDGH